MCLVALLSHCISLPVAFVVELKKICLYLSKFNFVQKGCSLSRFYFICRLLFCYVACRNLSYQCLITVSFAAGSETEAAVLAGYYSCYYYVKMDAMYKDTKRLTFYFGATLMWTIYQFDLYYLHTPELLSNHNNIRLYAMSTRSSKGNLITSPRKNKCYKYRKDNHQKDKNISIFITNTNI